MYHKYYLQKLEKIFSRPQLKAYHCFPYRHKEIGLVDRIGTLQDAIEAAASLAKVGAKDYRIKEYPEKKTFFQQIMDGYKKSVSSDLLKEELGAEIYQSMRQVKQVKQWVGVPQTRIPFITTTQF